MRALTPAEEGFLDAAERRRRAAAHYRYRLRALAEAQEFHDALIGGIGVPGTSRQARFKVAVRARQASLERSLLGTGPLLGLLVRAHQRALADAGFGGAP